MFVELIDQMMSASNNKIFKEKLKIYFFNKFLVGCIQDDVLNLI